MELLKEAFSASLGQKLKHPLMGIYTFSFIFYNKKLFYFMFWPMEKVSFKARMELIDSYDYLYADPIKTGSILLLISFLSGPVHYLISALKANLISFLAGWLSTPEIDEKYAMDLEFYKNIGELGGEILEKGSAKLSGVYESLLGLPDNPTAAQSALKTQQMNKFKSLIDGVNKFPRYKGLRDKKRPFSVNEQEELSNLRSEILQSVTNR